MAPISCGDDSTLRESEERFRSLAGSAPIGIFCTDAQGHWNQIESYIAQHSEVAFTHSYCPDCSRKFLSESGLNSDQ